MNAADWPLLIERLAQGAQIPVAAIESMTCRAAAQLAATLEARTAIPCSPPRTVDLERETLQEIQDDDEAGEWFFVLIDEGP